MENYRPRHHVRSTSRTTPPVYLVIVKSDILPEHQADHKPYLQETEIGPFWGNAGRDTFEVTGVKLHKGKHVDNPRTLEDIERTGLMIREGFMASGPVTSFIGDHNQWLPVPTLDHSAKFAPRAVLARA